MSDLGDRVIITIMAVAIALPLVDWIVGPYVRILPPWYASLFVPAIVAVVAIALAILVWSGLFLSD